MNLAPRWNLPLKLLYRIALRFRRLLPRKRCHTFGRSSTEVNPKIEHIYVINLDRQPTRWAEMQRELRHILDGSGEELLKLAERYDAVDAKHFTNEPAQDADINPFYTLGDQLFVEPQPLALPTRLELNSPIKMSRPEIAVARSHIGIWRQVAASNHKYVLILEDDVWFHSDFSSHLDQAWNEIKRTGDRTREFDILYVSYEEVKDGAPKTFISANVFQPVRGLWHLSGYIISREGAENLLRLLPCRGPIDLWINHMFGSLGVCATRSSIISQRNDLASTNSYSILPSLTRIGAITSEGSSLFNARPSEKPVFAFGPRESGLTSLAMALSMLGYRCCSDLQELPEIELAKLRSGANDRVFDAYTNIGSLVPDVGILANNYPKAKFIITRGRNISDDAIFSDITHALKEADVTILHINDSNKWKVICEHLRCSPPACSFPKLVDLGQEQIIHTAIADDAVLISRPPKRDISPWIIEPPAEWRGIHSIPTNTGFFTDALPIKFTDNLEHLDTRVWFPRNDTFTDNLALFRPSNIKFIPETGASFNIKPERLGVREYSAAALTSQNQYLFGRFEAIIKASNVPGVVTGLFLHRNSPRQEIDIEIAGNRTDRLLVNVFYNPGCDGDKYDYGYRGAASYIKLGFDASMSYHLYAIEWRPSEILWFVDNRLVHKRFHWDPTPIPNLPMSLHINVWPTRSKELAGKLTNRKLPAKTFVKCIALDTHAQIISTP